MVEEPTLTCADNQNRDSAQHVRAQPGPEPLQLSLVICPVLLVLPSPTRTEKFGIELGVFAFRWEEKPLNVATRSADGDASERKAIVRRVAGEEWLQVVSTTDEARVGKSNDVTLEEEVGPRYVSDDPGKASDDKGHALELACQTADSGAKRVPKTTPIPSSSRRIKHLTISSDTRLSRCSGCLTKQALPTTKSRHSGIFRKSWRPIYWCGSAVSGVRAERSCDRSHPG